jgi:nucleotide-binding universal stress UspA family protein
MYKQILVPLDGSNVAEEVLPYARYLAGKLKIPVELLGAVDLAGITSSIKTEKALNLEGFFSDSVRHSEAYLENISKTFRGITVGRTVAKGKPEELVIESAAGDSETLIAMATHGRSGVDRWLLGSVAEKVLRGTSNPLLLVRATEHGKTDVENMFKRVIVPLDGSPLAEKVLPHVTALAREMASKAVLVRAYDLSEVMSTFESYIPDWNALEQEAMRGAKSYLDGKVQELKSQGLSEVSSRVLEKEPAREIIGVAAEEPNSLIAMCTHGRSGVQRWVLGSVTEKVVRHSNCPVLVIPARGK